jgi:AcrR family transcriptional regulator
MNAFNPALPSHEADSDDAPRWRRRKDARPSEIVQAALELFVEKGYAAARTDDVAARAGVSKGTVYLYFANKQELFEAVIREGLVPVVAEAEELVENYQGSSFDLLDEFIWGWWERVGATKLSGITKLMMAEAGNFPEIAEFYQTNVVQRATDVVEKLLRRGIARGEFRPVDVSNMVHVMIAPMLFLFMWQNSFGLSSACKPVDAKAHVHNTLDLLKHGLASGPTSIAAPAECLGRAGVRKVKTLFAPKKKRQAGK